MAAAAEDRQSLESVLRGAELERSWQEFLNSWEDISPSQRQDCLTYVVALRDQFLWFLRGVTEPAEQRAAGAIFYLQVKSQCLLLTTQAGYQIASGKIEPSVYCCSRLLSSLLCAVESALNPADIGRIQDFLAPPTDDEEEDEKAVAPLLTDSGVRLPTLREGDASLPQRIAELETEAAELRAECDRLRALQLNSHDLPERVRAELTELASLRADCDSLARETGFDTTHDILAYVRGLEDERKDFRAALQARYAGFDAYVREFGDRDPKEIVEERRTLSARIAELEADIARRVVTEGQWKRALGTDNSDNAAQTLYQLRDRIGQLEAEAEVRAADWQLLSSKFAAEDAAGVVTKMRELNDAVTLLSTRLGQYEAERMVLTLELGCSDARDIIARFRALQSAADPDAEIVRSAASGKDVRLAA